MPTILGANSVRDTAYNVDNSIRLDGTDDHFVRTLSQAGTSNKAFTFSCWIKRSKRNSDVPRLIHMGGTGGSPTHYISVRFRDDQNGRLSFYTEAGGGGFQLNTNRLFRDTTGWMHIVVAVNSADSTESNRQRMYVNGVEETSFSSTTAMSLNSNLGFNDSSDVIYLFRKQQDTDHFPGYACEVAFIDGQQLAPTAFGEFDEDSPTHWKPIDFKNDVTFGTNGFYLEFKDSSDLGADTSGNGNDFTANSLAATDQTTDTCTNNFATMNPLDNYYASNTYSEGDIKFVTKASGGFAYGTSTVGLSSGKWYAEFDCIATTDSGAYHQVGIVEKPSASTTTSATANIGSTAYSWGYFALDGKYRNNASYSTYGDSWTTGDIIGVYLNLDDNELRFSKNGVIQNSGTAISITAPSSNGTGHYFITAGGMSTNASVTFEANFGNPFQSQSSSVSDANGYGAFEYSPTLSGVNYYSINTKNLAEFG